MQRIIQMPFYHVAHGDSGLHSDKKQQDQFAIHKHVTFQEEEWKIEPTWCFFSQNGVFLLYFFSESPSGEL